MSLSSQAATISFIFPGFPCSILADLIHFLFITNAINVEVGLRDWP